MENCCATRRGRYTRDWHTQNRLPLCERAIEETRMANLCRLKWVPGTPILVPEIDPL